MNVKQIGFKFHMPASVSGRLSVNLHSASRRSRFRFNPKKARAWVPVPAFLSRSRRGLLHRPLCRALRFHILHSGISFQVASCSLLSTYQRGGYTPILQIIFLCYFLSSIGSPQCIIVPLPPLVMIIPVPHFLHTYLLPIMFAIPFIPPFGHSSCFFLSTGDTSFLRRRNPPKLSMYIVFSPDAFNIMIYSHLSAE